MWAYKQVIPDTDSGVDPHYFIRGQVFSQGIAAYYEGKSVEEVIAVAENYVLNEGMGLDTDGVADGIFCLANYIEHYKNDDVYKANVVAVETEYALPGFEYTQRADLVVRINDRIYFVDHKIYGTFRDDGAANLAYDFQFVGYALLGLQVFGAKFGGVLVNVIVFDKRRQTIRFVRDIVPVTPQTVATWYATIVTNSRPPKPTTLEECIKFPATLPMMRKGYDFGSCLDCKFTTLCHGR